MRTALRYSSGPVAHMLLCAVNWSEPAFASRHPQFIGGREVGRRIVESADSNFDLVGAIDNREHGRPARGAKMTVVSDLLPASGLSAHRDMVRRPDRKKIANRAGLLSTHEAVAKADPERLAAHLKPHLTTVAAAHSVSHVSLQFQINERGALRCSPSSIVFFTSPETEALTTARWSRLRRIRRRPASPRHSRPSHCRSCLPASLARLRSPCFSSGRWIVQAPTREESEHCCCKNFGVHWRLLGSFGPLQRRYEVNTGHSAFDPVSS